MNISAERLKARITELAGTFLSGESNAQSLITVTKTDISKDGKRATVYFTAYPESEEKKALAFANRHCGDFARFLRTRLSLKHIPHITFALDEGEKNRQRIQELSDEDQPAA